MGARHKFNTPDTALSTRAVPLQDIATDGGYTVASVPVKVGQLLVSQQDKHLLAFGAVPFSSTNATDFDPLLYVGRPRQSGTIGHQLQRIQQGVCVFHVDLKLLAPYQLVKKF